ncbi:MAG: helix-turn-helix domain-containing protein [Candidatus Omnitrophota bacterium]|nr:MAG: helix-turn-helix domain-containing protein [Candidatus Omnitrophota bacterium]
MKLSPEIKAFIDDQIRTKKPSLTYNKLRQKVAQRYNVRISKATISKRASALNVRFRPGRRRAGTVEKRPAHSTALDCAGGFFLKGAELEIGLLSALNNSLKVRSDSGQARRVLMLARQLNAILLYAPVFGLKTVGEIASYQGQGLLYLAEQKDIPAEKEIEQYLQFLIKQKLLLPAIKEVTRISQEALFVYAELAGRKFYLDAQLRSVWPKPKIPQYFTATLNKTSSYVKDIFQNPSPQQPLILQACPGYAFLPGEMFDLIQCFEEAGEKPILRLVIGGKAGEVLNCWESLKPGQKCYFLAPLSPWQYAKLQGSKIIKDFKPYLIGPQKEPMSVAEAEVNLFNPQLNENVRVRAAMVRRQGERLVLVTNISRREERYIRRIVEAYFCRWPNRKMPSYYDLLEQGHEEVLARSDKLYRTTPLLTIGYDKDVLNGFRYLLAQLNRYAQEHFFPSEYRKEDLDSMCKKFYRQDGYLKMKQDCCEVTLRSFAQDVLQEAVQIARQKINQNGIKFPASRQGGPTQTQPQLRIK